jgi:hypothetical protein
MVGHVAPGTLFSRLLGLCRAEIHPVFNSVNLVSNDPGLQVLHSLIFDFLNHRTGRLDPSYAAILNAHGNGPTSAHQN